MYEVDVRYAVCTYLTYTGRAYAPGPSLGPRASRWRCFIYLFVICQKRAQPDYWFVHRSFSLVPPEEPSSNRKNETNGDGEASNDVGR